MTDLAEQVKMLREALGDVWSQLEGALGQATKDDELYDAVIKVFAVADAALETTDRPTYEGKLDREFDLSVTGNREEWLEAMRRGREQDRIRSSLEIIEEVLNG